jgi:hypothetical protein
MMAPIYAGGTKLVFGIKLSADISVMVKPIVGKTETFWSAYLCDKDTNVLSRCSILTFQNGLK